MARAEPGAAEPRLLRFAVRGMTCASCVAHVERAIAGMPGVSNPAVNLPLERAEALASPALAPRIVAAIEAEGYEARLVDDGASIGAEQARRAAEQASDEARLRRDAWTAALLSLPVIILEMGAHLLPSFHHWQHETLGPDLPRWLSFALTAVVLAGPGRRFFRIGVPALLRGRPEMNALVALGSGAAFLYSAVATLAPGWFPEGGAEVYFESAATIVTLILAGRLIETRSRGRTGAAIRELMALQPDIAIRLRDGEAVATPVSEIMVGDLLLVKPGAGLPTDGEVVDGASHVDEAMLTGEPIPVHKTVGALVHGGSVNGAGALTIRATKVGGETLLAGIIRLVEQAQGAKLPIQARIDSITAVFVPVVLAIAAITFLAWLTFGPAPSLPLALVAAVSVLIIACPCAMGLATPISVAVATGRAAQLGALFRKGDALERLGKARLVAFDKTGTLTLGRPALSAVEPVGDFTADQLLAMAAAVERSSEHPIARAILKAAQERGLAVPEAAGFEALSGVGAAALVEGKRVAIGGERMMALEKVSVEALTPRIEAHADRGETPFFMAVEGRLAGFVTVADPVKPGMAELIASLRGLGLVPAMISGDHERTARAVAGRLGIAEVSANVLPAGKVDVLERLRAAHGPVIFVGDGLNDAPALAAADIGVAVGDGTTVAIESADVVLVSGDLGALVQAVGLSRAALRNMTENLIWAFGYNVALIPVAAGLFQPALGWMLSPMLAAGAMALSSVFVVFNALRLGRFGRPAQPA